MADPSTTSDVAPDQVGKKTITVRVEPDLWREFRAITLRRGFTVQTVVEEWMGRYVEHHRGER